MKSLILILLSSIILTSCNTAPLKEKTESSPPLEAGGITECEHTPDYHSIDSELIDYIGQEKFNEWYIAAAGSIYTDIFFEDINIVRFIRDNEIPKEIFTSVYYDTSSYYYYDYDVDLIYSDDDKAIEDYFTDKETSIKRHDKKRTVAETKSLLARKANYEMTSPRKTSLAELYTLAENNAAPSTDAIMTDFFTANAQLVTFNSDNFWTELCAITDPCEQDEYFINNVNISYIEEEIEEYEIRSNGDVFINGIPATMDDLPEDVRNEYFNN